MKKKSMEEVLKEALSNSEAMQKPAEPSSPQRKPQAKEDKPNTQKEPVKEQRPVEQPNVNQKAEEPKKNESKREAVNLDDRENGQIRQKEAPQFIEKETPEEAPKEALKEPLQEAPKKESKKPQKYKEPINSESKPKLKSKININPKHIFGILLALALFMYVYGVLVSLKKGEVPRNCVMPHIALVNGFTNIGSYALLMILLVIAIIITVVILFGNKSPKTDRVFVSDMLGSSSFATEEDKKALVHAGRRFEDMPSFIYGTDESTGEIIGYKPGLDFVNFNTAICGPQKSGKSFMLVRNNLAQLMKLEQSVIITDPKGEMYRDMSEAFIEAGYIVKQLNTEDFYASDSWNILGDINIDNIDPFVKTFIANISDSREQQVYTDVKCGLLKALCLYVMYEDKDLEPKDKNLSTVYEMLQHNKLTELDAKFEALNNNSEAKSTYMIWKNADKLRQNSVTTLGMGMQFLSNRAVKQVVSVSDIDIQLPAKEKCAYFLIFNQDNNTYKPITSVFIRLLIETLTSYAKKQITGTCDRRIHFMLDEFPALGRIADFEIGLGVWRSFGIDVSIIFQNLPMLRDRYPENIYLEILGACSIQICLGANEPETQKYYSDMCGVGTVKTTSTRRNKNKLTVLDTNYLTQQAETESYVQSKVMYPEEIGHLMQNGKLLLVVAGSRPFKLNKLGFDKNPMYPVKQNLMTNNIPLWLKELRSQTKYATANQEGYGGLYTLGNWQLISERARTLFEEWLEEDTKGEVEPTALPASLDQIKSNAGKMNSLTREEADYVGQLIDEIINKRLKEKAGYKNPEPTEGETGENKPEGEKPEDRDSENGVYNSDSDTKPDTKPDTENQKPINSEGSGPIEPIKDSITSTNTTEPSQDTESINPAEPADAPADTPGENNTNTPNETPDETPNKDSNKTKEEPGEDTDKNTTSDEKVINSNGTPLLTQEQQRVQAYSQTPNISKGPQQQNKPAKNTKDKEYTPQEQILMEVFEKKGKKGKGNIVEL